jgi:hypothetical protein
MMQLITSDSYGTCLDELAEMHRLRFPLLPRPGHRDLGPRSARRWGRRCEASRRSERSWLIDVAAPAAVCTRT